MDTGLHQNEAELAVTVLAVELQVLAHGHRLLDEVVQVLGDLGGQAQALQDTQDGGAVDCLHLGDAVLVTQQDTDLGGGRALASCLGHELNHLLQVEISKCFDFASSACRAHVCYDIQDAGRAMESVRRRR